MCHNLSLPLENVYLGYLTNYPKVLPWLPTIWGRDEQISFYIGPESKNFRVCERYSIFGNYSILQL